MATYNILACDGGGVRGAFTAELIKNLEEDVPGFTANIDLFAGTSVGSANALALASGRTPAEMVDFYKTVGPSMFSQRLTPKGFLGEIVEILSRIPGVGKVLGDLDLLFIAKWSNAELHEGLVEFFKEITLGELSKKVALPTLAVDGKINDSSESFTVPAVMHNFEGSDFLDVLARDAMMRSGAAPTYFESYQGYVDGGLVANNPSMVAIASAVDPHRGGKKLSEVRMLSIGTGVTPEGITKEQPLDWGIVQWGPIVYNVSSTSVSELTSYQATHILEENYNRLNLVLTETIKLDDGAAIPRLIELADQMRADKNCEYEAAKEFVRKNFVSGT